MCVCGVCGCACMCQWLFARGFVGSRHCLLALFQLGEVHVVAIVRIQVRNSSPFCLLPSPLSIDDSRFSLALMQNAQKCAQCPFCQAETPLFLLCSLSSLFPAPSVPYTECGIVCKVRSIFKHVCKELCSDSLLKRTRWAWNSFPLPLLSLPSLPVFPFLCFLCFARFDECAPRRVHGTKIDTKVRDIIAGGVKGALNLGLSGRVRCFNTKLSFLTTKCCYT